MRGAIVFGRYEANEQLDSPSDQPSNFPAIGFVVAGNTSSPALAPKSRYFP